MVGGNVKQSAHRVNQDDYRDERINFPVLGIVLRTYYSDNIINKSALVKHDQRGSRCEAQVLVLNDGTDTPWVINNAVILPAGASGVDNFQEEFPKACTQMIDGSRFDGTFTAVDAKKLDGDYCIVQFIGGNIHQPIITSWFPHPGNVKDPGTSGFIEGVLNQSNRFFKRYQGSKFIITTDGSIYINTNEANGKFVGGKGGAKRLENELWGDIQVDVKSTRALEVNFNKTVDTPTIPSLPQANPPGVTQERGEDYTKLRLDKYFIDLVAGQVVQMIGKQVTDSILLGEIPTEHAVMGETLRDAFNALTKVVNDHIEKYNGHGHIDGNGTITSAPTDTDPAAGIASGSIKENPLFPNTTGTPLPAGPTNPQYIFLSADTDAGVAADLPEAALSTVVKLQG